ncbi:hypothetical protein MKX03_030588 [Papaver bracteatum]|nr:hypothetical protein MKX03_030588 [Papaver bracteatum]
MGSSSQKRKIDEIYSSEEEGSDISESEMDDYEEKVYQKLKNGKFTVKVSDLKFRCPFCLGKKKQVYEYKDLVPHAKGAGKKSSSLKKFREKAKHLALARYLEKDCAPIREDPMEEDVEDGKTVVDVFGSSTLVEEEKFVHPWKGVVANTEREVKDGRYIAPSGNRIKEQLVKFNPIRVHSLWDGSHGSIGMEIVEFRNDLSGFCDAMTFESYYNSFGRGKRHYLGDQRGQGGLYGWVAREDDYRSDSVLGKNLRKSDLKTIKDVQAEYVRKNQQLVTNLVHLINEKNDNLEKINLELNETSCSLKNLAERVEFQKQELKIRSGELEKIKAQSESDREKLAEEKRKNAMKTSNLEMVELESTKNVLRIAEEQKRMKEARLRERIEEEKKLDAKDKLELEVELLRGKLKALTYMEDDDADLESKKKLEELTKDLKEEIEGLEALNQTLTVKERESNDELQDARKELINEFKELGSRAPVRVKRMGEIDLKPFKDACKKKYTSNEEEMQTKIDEKDERLSRLRNDMGDEVFKVVATALLELNDYNGSGRYIVPKLWNFKEGRKETLKEGIQRLIKKNK